MIPSIVRSARQAVHPHPSRRSQEGQTLLIFSLCAILIFAVIGFAVDGGYGLFQQGEAQNAADFASLAVANDIATVCDSAATVPQSTVVNTIADVVALNDPQEPSSWNAYYLDTNHNEITDSTFSSSSTDTSYGSDVPTGACGIQINVTPKWRTFVEGIIGVQSLSATATAQSIYNGPQPGASLGISIVSLDPHGAHTIFMGTGTFNVTGTIADDADGVVCSGSCSGISQNWGSSTYEGVTSNEDVVDEKADGELNVQGTIQSVVNNPFDSCFGSPTAASAPYDWQVECGGSEYINYQELVGDGPTAGDKFSGYPSPDSIAGCASKPSSNPVLYGGIEYYYPGYYTSLVNITKNSVFVNCSASTTTPADVTAADVSGQSGPCATTTTPGVFVFEQGLEVRPGNGDSVTGCNVLLTGTAPISQFAGGGVPDKEWLLENPEGTKSANYNYDTNFCGTCGSEALPSSDYGPNFSIEMGGTGTITLAGITVTSQSSEYYHYDQFVVWQDNSSAYCSGSVDATTDEPTCDTNLGFDAFPEGAQETSSPTSGYSCNSTSNCSAADSATITIDNSVLYDDSQPEGNLMSDGDIVPDYYNSNGSNGGYPFSEGGAIDVGSGDDCSTSGLCTSGTVNVSDGVVLVGRFSTDGDTTFNITGNTDFTLPGVAGSGPSLIG